jgi:hypothetical protein
MVCDPEEARRRSQERENRECASEAAIDTYDEMSFDPVTDEWLANHGIQRSLEIPDQIDGGTYVRVDNTGSIPRRERRLDDISDALDQ